MPKKTNDTKTNRVGSGGIVSDGEATSGATSRNGKIGKKRYMPAIANTDGNDTYEDYDDDEQDGLNYGDDDDEENQDDSAAVTAAAAATMGGLSTSEISGSDMEHLRAKRREANRIHAMKSRQRSKSLLSDLQEAVSQLSRDKADLERKNAVLRAQADVLAQQNRALLASQQSLIKLQQQQQQQGPKGGDNEKDTASEGIMEEKIESTLRSEPADDGPEGNNDTASQSLLLQQQQQQLMTMMTAMGAAAAVGNSGSNSHPYFGTWNATAAAAASMMNPALMAMAMNPAAFYNLSTASMMGTSNGGMNGSDSSSSSNKNILQATSASMLNESMQEQHSRLMQQPSSINNFTSSADVSHSKDDGILIDQHDANGESEAKDQVEV
jgi:hypothetical protein